MTLAREHRLACQEETQTRVVQEHFKETSAVLNPGPLIRLAPALPLGHRIDFFDSIKAQGGIFQLPRGGTGEKILAQLGQLSQALSKFPEIKTLQPTIGIRLPNSLRIAADVICTRD